MSSPKGVLPFGLGDCFFEDDLSDVFLRLELSSLSLDFSDLPDLGFCS